MGNIEFCVGCKYVDFDYSEYSRDAKQCFTCGCKKDLEPYYSEEEGVVTCEGYERVSL